MQLAELVVAIVMALSSLVLGWLTWQLRVATDAMAESARHRPYVYLFMHAENGTVGLRNIGDRVAHDVRVEILKDDTRNAPMGFLGQVPMLQHPVQSIPPGGETKDGSVLGVISPGSDAEFAVEIRYCDLDGRCYRELTRARAADYAEWFVNMPMGGKRVANGPPGPSRG